MARRDRIKFAAAASSGDWHVRQSTLVESATRPALPDVLPDIPPLNQRLPISRRTGDDGVPERRCRSCGDYLPEDTTFFRVYQYDPYAMAHVCRDCEDVIYAERRAATRHRGRAKRQGIASDLPPNIMKTLYAAQNGRCFYCNDEFDRCLDDRFHLEHKVPLSRGGTNAADNLVLSCPSCNSMKGSRTPEEWRGAPA